MKKTARPQKRSSRPSTPQAYLRPCQPISGLPCKGCAPTSKRPHPDLEECISYGIPAFRYEGKFLLAYGATAKYCSFYPGSVVQTLAPELKDYDVSKGTIRFDPDKPLPKSLVRKLVKSRLAQRA